MIFSFFGQKSNKSLGIDIGTYSIKIVELEKTPNDIILSNYGMLKSERLFQEVSKSEQEFYNKAKFSIKTTVEGLNLLLKTTKINSKNVTFAIPDFHTFLNSFAIPISEDEKELAQMVSFEIQKYIPIPYSALKIDWFVTSSSSNVSTEEKNSNEKNQPSKTILFAAIPKEIILQYEEISKRINFKSIELETEIFSLIRALTFNTDLKNLVVLIEIGVQSTTISIVEKRKLKISYSFNISGFEIDRLIVSSLKIDLKEAEDFKKQYGLIGIPPSREKSNKNIILPLINLILEKYEQTTNAFLKNRQDKIEEIYLSGGTASLPGLAEYFSYRLKIPTNILNPLKNLKKIKMKNKNDQFLLGHTEASYTIAMGAALKKLLIDSK